MVDDPSQRWRMNALVFSIGSVRTTSLRSLAPSMRMMRLNLVSGGSALVPGFDRGRDG